jgi:hypothetical protein
MDEKNAILMMYRILGRRQGLETSGAPGSIHIGNIEWGQEAGNVNFFFQVLTKPAHQNMGMSQNRSAPSSLFLVKKGWLGALSCGTPILRHPHMEAEPLAMFTAVCPSCSRRNRCCILFDLQIRMLHPQVQHVCVEQLVGSSVS